MSSFQYLSLLTHLSYLILQHVNIINIINICFQLVYKGRPLHLLDEERCNKYREEMDKSKDYNYNGATEWPGLLRMLDRRDKSYAT